MKGLTLTIVTPKIQSINYAETIGNISTLKKLSTGTGYPKQMLTYFSDKVLKYDVKRIGREQYGWKLMDSSIQDIFVDNSLVITKKENNEKFKEKVKQDSELFAMPEEEKNEKRKNKDDVEYDYTGLLKLLIQKFEEFDLFGGMFADLGKIFETKGNKNDKTLNINGKKVKIETEKIKRSQPVRFSNGYSISEFVYDTNLLNDIDSYHRYGKYVAGEKKQSIVSPEEHYSFYTYSLSVDLDKIGAIVKENNGQIIFEPVLSPDERIKRVNNLLEIVLLYLNREIRGRKERLTPVFAIGGIYDVKHPFFENALTFSEKDQKLHFKFSDIKNIFDTYHPIYDLSKETYLFFDKTLAVPGDTPFEGLNIKSLSEMLLEMKEKIKDYYTGKEF